MFDRLMGRAIFAEPDRIMRKDEDHPLAHQRRHAQCIAAVVAEGQEGAAIGNEAAVQCQSVEHGAHAELAHTEIQMAPGHEGLSFGAAEAPETAGALPVGEVGSGQIGRAAEQFGQRRAEMIQRVLGGLAGRNGFAFGDCIGNRPGHRALPGRRQHAAHATLELCRLVRMTLRIGPEALVPISLDLRTAPGRIPGSVDIGRHLEGTVRPAHGALGTRDFVGAQRLTVTPGGTGASRGAITNHGSALNQGRRESPAVVGLASGYAPLPGQRDSSINRLDIMAVDAGNHIPAVGVETPHSVVAKPGIDGSVDRNRVVVIQDDQLGQAPDTGE